jgi:signal transduction histidine kinase
MERERYLAGLGQASTAIVHDLRNPLITIEGFARRIQNGKGDTVTATRTIIDSVALMQSIVKDVLDFAKPIRLELSEIEIKNVLKRAYDLCATKAEERGVTLELKTSDLALLITADSFQMIRAFENLLSNAIDASSEGQSVVVSASTEKNLIVVRIKDQGAGMDKETLKNIFIPFYTRKSSGTGLGMPLAKKIIEGHKGKILIESQLARGTEVIVSLPAK